MSAIPKKREGGAMSPVNPQDVYKAHLAFGEAHPEWMQQANGVVNGWGRKDFTLQHGIALALMDAYDRGARGEPPVYVPHEEEAGPKRISRAPKPATPTPETPKVRVIRRTQ
jgi:hypothetical protein